MSVLLSNGVSLGSLTTTQRNALTGCEFYNGTKWVEVVRDGIVSSSGGTTASVGGYTVHTFTSSGTFTLSDGLGDVEVLVVV